MATSGKNAFWKPSLFWARISVSMSKVPAPTWVNRAKIAVKMKMEPAISIIISFIAPYSLRVEPQTAMSRYIGRRATS